MVEGITKPSPERAKEHQNIRRRKKKKLVGNLYSDLHFTKRT